MPIYRLQCSFAADTSLPRDRLVMTPHFNRTGTGGIDGDDPQALCDDLADGLVTWAGITTETQVTAYDAQGTKPVYPAGNAVRNAGTAVATPCPREVAVCLSFYGTRNIPRQRGRLYVPLGIMMAGTGGVQCGLRPNTATRAKTGALVDLFTNLGGINVDWCVYSPTANVAHSATNWWVDDEWDTVRSRGLRATTRLTGTTTE